MISFIPEAIVIEAKSYRPNYIERKIQTVLEQAKNEYCQTHNLNVNEFTLDEDEENELIEIISARILIK